MPNLIQSLSLFNTPIANPGSKRRKASKIKVSDDAVLVRLLRPICPVCDTGEYLVGPPAGMHTAALVCVHCRLCRGYASKGLLHALEGL
jgi:hypothetical protein